MGLIDEVGQGPTAIDTSVFIYLIEEHPTHLSRILPLFEQAAAGQRELVTSALTLLEVLVVPLRAGDTALAEQYERLLTSSRGVRVRDITRNQLRAAAELRAVTGVKTPDAIQLVAALEAQCGAFVTSDRRLPRIPGLRIVQV